MPAHVPGKATATLLGLALVAGAAGATISARSATAEAERVERAELAAASTDLARELAQLRAVVAAPTHDAQQTTAALQVLTAEAITGSDRDPAAVAADIERQAALLRDQADRIEEAAAVPMPDRPDALPVADVDPLFARIDPLEDQLLDLAEDLRASADAVTELGAVAAGLHGAAADYAATVDAMPEGDDPDVHATAWRNERSRLADYRAAVEQAASFPGIEDLAAAHAELLDALDAFADESLAALEAGDVDGYNARVAAGVGDDVLATWRSGLEAGAETALESPAILQLDRSRALALGVVKELDNVRRSSNSALAVG
ncbi:hypothetical protein [Egicoccus sp. AB-alg6-2]|uniref:hypothetical protein n=1 Tax=Egicoccus sp. AB-alg6-2 TaxID=3242692 RepID=UPI00359E12B6